MDAMGDKANAKKTMIENDVPVVPAPTVLLGRLRRLRRLPQRSVIR